VVNCAIAASGLPRSRSAWPHAARAKGSDGAIASARANHQSARAVCPCNSAMRARVCRHGSQSPGVVAITRSAAENSPSLAWAWAISGTIRAMTASRTPGYFCCRDSSPRASDKIPAQSPASLFIVRREKNSDSSPEPGAKPADGAGSASVARAAPRSCARASE